MHDALRQRLLRRIESLPDEQIYQVLDFIEFLESKYAGSEPVEASGLQKFAESFEDKLRRKAVSPSTIREAFQLISAADRVLHGVSSAGKQILSDLNTALDVPENEEASRRRGGASGLRRNRPDGFRRARGGRRSRRAPIRGGGGRCFRRRGCAAVDRLAAAGGVDHPRTSGYTLTWYETCIRQRLRART